MNFRLSGQSQRLRSCAACLGLLIASQGFAWGAMELLHREMFATPGNLTSASPEEAANADWTSGGGFTVGKYLERRQALYATDLFAGSGGGPRRTIHLGIDIGAPVGRPVMAPYGGVVAFCGYNPAPGDYGYCVITEHVL